MTRKQENLLICTLRFFEGPASGLVPEMIKFQALENWCLSLEDKGERETGVSVREPLPSAALLKKTLQLPQVRAP